MRVSILGAAAGGALPRLPAQAALPRGPRRRAECSRRHVRFGVEAARPRGDGRRQSRA
jgi:hypothetical protein